MTSNTAVHTEADDDARWANWKPEGARRDVRRKDRVRRVIAALCLGSAAWLIFRLF